MNHRRFEFLSGIFLALTVSPVWWLGLCFLLYLYAKKRPAPIPTVHPYLKIVFLSVSVSALAGAVLTLIMGGSGLLGSQLLDSFALLGRITTFGVLVASYTSWKLYRKSNFWHGLLLMFIIHGVVMVLQIFVPGLHAGYARGFQNHSSLAGFFGAVAMASPVSHFAGLSLALSHSRSYILSTLLTGVYLRNRQILVCSVVALIIVWAVDSNRISWTVHPGTLDGSISESIQSHIFYTPAPWKWYGYGYSNFNEATGFGMPHNIGVLMWYEFGVFSVIPFLALSYAFVRLKLWHLLPLLVAGMFTPELYERPQGIGGIVIYHLSMMYAKESKLLKWWQKT